MKFIAGKNNREKNLSPQTGSFKKICTKINDKPLHMLTKGRKRRRHNFIVSGVSRE